VICDPRVERRGRLFEQRELRQARLDGRLHGEFARLFVERSGNGEHDILLGERRAVRAVPSLAHVREEA
jgi:hypothetical protein